MSKKFANFPGYFATAPANHQLWVTTVTPPLTLPIALLHFLERHGKSTGSAWSQGVGVRISLRLGNMSRDCSCRLAFGNRASRF
jgi:hypothetical protein